MIARITHEHAERDKLEQARQELLKRKQALIAENKKRKDDLANLDQDLEKFIDVCFCSILPPETLLVISLLKLTPQFQCRPRNQSRKSSRRNIRSMYVWDGCRVIF